MTEQETTGRSDTPAKGAEELAGTTDRSVREYRSAVSVALFLLVVIACGLWVRPPAAQEISRYALTAAIADKGTVQLDDYSDIMLWDRSIRDGELYSDKAPGQPVLGIPAYLGYRAVGEPLDAASARDIHLGVWWMTLWSATLPLAILAVLVFRYLADIEPRWALFSSLALVFGTLLFPFGTMLFGHVMAACLLFGAFYLITHSRGMAQLLLAGTLLGAAVVVEYTSAFAVVALLVLAAWAHQWRAGLLLPGGILMASLLGIYNMAAFENPLVLSYQYTAFTEVTETARNVTAMFSSFQLDNAFALLFAPRGLLLATPLVLMGVAGLIMAIRSGSQRRSAMVSLVILVAFLAIPVFWGNPWGGLSPGPRYMTPALPFLALGVATAAARWSRLTAGLALLGMATMVAAVLTEPRVAPDVEGGLGIWLNRLMEADVVSPLASFFVGDGYAWTITSAAVVATGGWLYHVHASRFERTHVLP